MRMDVIIDGVTYKGKERETTEENTRVQKEDFKLLAENINELDKMDFKLDNGSSMLLGKEMLKKTILIFYP